LNRSILSAQRGLAGQVSNPVQNAMVKGLPTSQYFPAATSKAASDSWSPRISSSHPINDLPILIRSSVDPGVGLMLRVPAMRVILVAANHRAAPGSRWLNEMDFAKANLMEFVRAGNADVPAEACYVRVRGNCGRRSNSNRVFPVQKRNDDGDSSRSEKPYCRSSLQTAFAHASGRSTDSSGHLKRRRSKNDVRPLPTNEDR
jgi:hypothetical protein